MATIKRITGLVIGWCSTIDDTRENHECSHRGGTVAEVESDDSVDQKISIMVSACDSAAKHYDDYARTFAGLDTKAQGVTTVSGIVIAAVVSFFKDGGVVGLVKANHWWLVLILSVPITALIAIFISLWGSRVTEFVMPFDAPTAIADAETVLQTDAQEFSRNEIVTYYQGRLDHWKEAFESIASVTEQKAIMVARGQGVMFVSLVLLSVLFVVVLAK
jgi:hypothetical protein